MTLEVFKEKIREAQFARTFFFPVSVAGQTHTLAPFNKMSDMQIVVLPGFLTTNRIDLPLSSS